MGQIKFDVMHSGVLSNDDKCIAKYFTNGFNVNYGDVINEANTKITIFILQPEDYVKEGFGLEKEVVLAISYYDKMEARTIQAIESVFDKYPFKNRVDNLCYFLVSKCATTAEWIKLNYNDTNNSSIIIPFTIDELVKNKSENWFIRDRLRRYSFDKDLFGYMLPLQNDNSFFGRQQILGRYIAAIKRCQNQGIFGLRKTGKTSLLFKIMRTIKEQKIGQVFFFDCKNPSIRKKRWYDFMYDINMTIAARLGINGFESGKNELLCVESFKYLMRKSSARNTKIILIFDEIEYISYFTKQDIHWQKDYFDFWQTLWSEQSTFGNLCFIICGVNSYVTERDAINGIQNPLFGIVKSEYLIGLTKDETSMMVRTLGKRMGLKFGYDAVDFLFEQYNGHPMLTRLACSWLNTSLINESRPVNINQEKIKVFQEEITADPAFYSYFGHIVAEIKQFYPDEYEMLEILSAGQTDDYIELASASEFVQHLNAYGLICTKNNIPQISMPVAEKYIAIEYARREKRKAPYKLVDKEKRQSWITHKVGIIIDTLRDLEKNIIMKKRPLLFGINSFPEAEKLKKIKEVVDADSFSNFINTLYRCLVESVNNYGKSNGDTKYLENTICMNYPILFRTLDKIKEYRNERDHLLLTEYHQNKLNSYLMEDLEAFDRQEDKFYCIQQKILVELIVSIYSETTNL